MRHSRKPFQIGRGTNACHLRTVKLGKGKTVFKRPNCGQSTLRGDQAPMKAQPSLAVRGLLCRSLPGFLLFLLCGFAFAQKMPESGQGPSVAPTFILGNPSDYAGIDRCRSCHKPEYREYEKTAHAKVSVP